MHLGIAGLVGILCRRGLIDNRRIDDRAGGDPQPVSCKMPLHRRELLTTAPIVDGRAAGSRLSDVRAPAVPAVSK